MQKKTVGEKREKTTRSAISGHSRRQSLQVGLLKEESLHGSQESRLMENWKANFRTTFVITWILLEGMLQVLLALVHK